MRKEFQKFAVSMLMSVLVMGSFAGCGEHVGVLDPLRQEKHVYVPGGSGSTETEEPEHTHKVSAGDLYYLAKDYKEVKALLKQNRWYAYDDCVVNEMAVEESVAMDSAVSNTAGAGVSAEVPKGDFSETNVVQEGVGEADVVKTDGAYIYRVTEDGHGIVIIDIRGDLMEVTASIAPECSDSYYIPEIYISGERLYVIASSYGDYGYRILMENTVDAEETSVAEPKDETLLLTYDISDRSNPALIETVRQDGSYHTSRMADGHIYLFSDKYIYRNYYYWDYRNLFDVDSIMEVGKQAIEEEKDETYIPSVQGCLVDPDCIYLRDWADKELIVSSVALDDPGEVKDTIVICDSYSQIYVGTESIYLYRGTYEADQNRSMTEIARFSYKDGYMSAEAANKVVGSIDDVFAISQKDGYLRVLTSELDYGTWERRNRLTILNDTMEIVGIIGNIAPGESIKAARYMGDLAYFITYENTDPLYIADLSESTNPILLGEAKITGFSEYLHPYGAGEMLGIGVETDEETGSWEGMKLVMFDVTNPANPVVANAYVLPHADYSNAMYDYKSVLVSYEKDLIGFATASWYDYDWSGTAQYVVYGWNGEEFVEKLTVKLSSYEDMYKIRGIYAGSRLYLVYSDHVVSYDMTNSFAQIDEFYW